MTDGLRNRRSRKDSKLERYFAPETEIHATPSVRRKDTQLKLQPMKGTIIRAEQTTEDMYASIDAVGMQLNGQLEKYIKVN